MRKSWFKTWVCSNNTLCENNWISQWSNLSGVSVYLQLCVTTRRMANMAHLGHHRFSRLDRHQPRSDQLMILCVDHVDVHVPAAEGGRVCADPCIEFMDGVGRQQECLVRGDLSMRQRLVVSFRFTDNSKRKWTFRGAWERPAPQLHQSVNSCCSRLIYLRVWFRLRVRITTKR